MATTIESRAQRRTGPLAVKLGYSAGNLGKSVVWTSFESFMLFYLVSFVGLHPLVAGGLLAAALLWDATVDVTIACWTDRHGRADLLARLVLFGAPLCGVGFWLAFSLDAPVAIGLAIIACRIGYSLCDVGHNTLLIRVARTPGDAATVSGLRLMFSAGGAGLLALASGRSLSIADAGERSAAFSGAAMIGGILYVVTLFGALVATRHLPSHRRGGSDVRPSRRLLALWRHPSFRRTLVLAAVQATMIPLFLRALPFFGRAVHGDASWAGPALATIALAQSLSLPGWVMLARRRRPAAIAAIAYSVMIVAMAGLAMRSDGAAGTVMLLMMGSAFGGMNLAIWALLAVSVQSAITGGSTDEATPVGMFLGVLKAAAAVGNIGFALIVAAAGDHASLLPLCVVTLPAIGCVAALFLVRRWPAP